MTRQPSWVILCRIPEKRRTDIEEIVDEMKQRDRGERKINESEETEEHSPSTLTLPLEQVWQGIGVSKYLG